MSIRRYRNVEHLLQEHLLRRIVEQVCAAHNVHALFAIVEQNGELRVAGFKITKNLIRRTGPSLPDVYVFHADQPTSSMRLRIEIAGKSGY